MSARGERSEVTAVAALAAEVMVVEDVTVGVPPGDSIRVRGRLLLPAHEAWQWLAQHLRPLGRTPLLRRRTDADGDELLALPLTFRAAPPRVAVALVLFVLTLLSCLFAGAQMVEGLVEVNWNLLDGLPFASTLLTILLAHEFGHYFTARRLGSPTSLPYFIPLPISIFGTLGAVITAGTPIRNRRHLLAIGAAGPLAGLVLAIPLLWIGLGLSQVQPLPAGPYSLEGNSLLYAAMKVLMFGRFLPSGGEDVFIHQIAFAGWAGLLVTGLNLLPVGQLDGGHIAYALLGRQRARVLGWIVMALLAGLSLLWTGWLVVLGLLLLVGRVQDMPLDDITELTGGQKLLALMMGVILVLVFVPIPLVIVG
ncbi:MAG: site-2 protease family protein [Anaerolineae bacterium]